METQQRCHLLELPVELRVRIYEHLYSETATLSIDVNVQGIYELWPSGDSDVQRPALLETCQLIREEAHPIMYATTILNVELHGGDDRPYRKEYGWLESCLSLCHLGKVGELKISRCTTEEDSHAVAARLKTLFASLNSEKPAAIEKIRFDHVRYFGAILDALISLDPQPGVEVHCNVPHAFDWYDSISSDVAQKFVEKYSGAAGWFPHLGRSGMPESGLRHGGGYWNRWDLRWPADDQPEAWRSLAVYPRMSAFS